MKIKILIVFVWMISTISMTAQSRYEQTVSGIVYDLDKNPLPDISIGILGTTTGVQTDKDGRYSLSIPIGEFILKVSSIEYEFKEVKTKINKGEHKAIDFFPIKNKTNLSEVTVTAKTTGQQIREGAFSVNVIDLNKYANTTTDINQVLRRSPGVTIRENGGVGSDFSFKINGLDAKIFIDGVPMENFGSSMTLNNIPVNLVDRVEIYKGVVPAYLSTDVLGGAVNIITKRRNRKLIDVSYGYGSFNTHQLSAIVNISDPKTGFTVRTNAFFNHSDNDYTMYSNNKYDISLKEAIKAVDENGNLILDDDGNPQWKMVEIDKAKRFYDDYTSGMGKIEAGFENVKWADRFLFGLTYSENKNQLQLGSSVNALYGGRWSENKYIMPTLQFKKDSLFTSRLFTELFVSYGKSTTAIRDTAQHIYDWTGKAIPFSQEQDPTHLEYKNTSYIAKADFTYSFNDSRTKTLNLNYSFTTNQQKSYDLMETDENYRNTSGLPNRIGKHLINLAWNGQWLNNKLNTVLSAKYYAMDISSTVDERTTSDDGKVTGAINTYKKYNDYKSASLALRYLLRNDAGIKGSVERAYNLPNVLSMFGDGVDYLPNTSIKPERSDNFNLGIFYNTFLKKDHFINVDVTGFYRNANNYIQPLRVGDKYQYQNIPGAKLYGFEFELKYGYKDIVSLAVNGSYDKAIENERYTDETKQEESVVYKQQLPNRPWIYGNVDLSLGKNNLLGKGTRIELSYMYQYIHWFYLSWANLGDPGTKNYIPSQNIHTALASFSWDQNKYSISVEARNFTNALAYDNYRLQKPGRAFFAKFRISIM